MENKEEVMKLLEEGVEEREETGLVVRKSRNANKPTSEFELEVSNRVSGSNGHAIVAANGTKHQEVEDEEEEVPIPEEEPTVDVLEVGINGSENKVPIPEEEPKAEVLEVGINGSEDKIPIHEENYKIEDLDGIIEVGSSGSTINGEHKPQDLVFHDKDEGIGPALHKHTEEKQIQKDVKVISILSNEIESVGAEELINEEDLDADDLDVEGVLKKQNTHDLYCPNCNSCITRRVILRKRKQRVRPPGEEAKRTKNDTELGAATARPRDGTDLGDIQPLTTDEDELSSRGTSIFKCLSCFSFFVPIGNGLSRMFGEKKASGNTVDEPALSTNETRNQDSTMIETRRPSDGTVAVAVDNDAKSRGRTLVFPRQNGQLIIAGRDELDMAPTETIDAKLEEFDSYTEDRVKESKVNKDVHITHESDLSIAAFPATNQFTNGESNEVSISFPNKGGLKFLVPESNGSPVTENSNSKDSRVSNQTMQSGDKGTFHPLPASISVLQALDVNGNLSIPVPVPHKDRDTATHVESVIENKILPSDVSEVIATKTKADLHSSEPIKVHSISYPPAGQGKDTVITIDAATAQSAGSSQVVPDVIQPPETTPLLQAASEIAERTEERKEYQVEVIKSMVYGGLAELITSLSVVSSAAGGGAATLNVLALGMANLIGGLFIIFHNLWELRDECPVQVANQISDGVTTEQKDRYKELLGRRQNFILHATVAIISYLVFGLLPPALYGFSFRQSDDRQLKLVMVGVASLICIVSLAIGKAYVRTAPKQYLKCVMSFVILGFMVSGVSYAVGKLVERILVKFGVFPPSADSNPSKGMAWAAY